MTSLILFCYYGILLSLAIGFYFLLKQEDSFNSRGEKYTHYFIRSSCLSDSDVMKSSFAWWAEYKFDLSVSCALGSLINSRRIPLALAVPICSLPAPTTFLTLPT